MVVCPREVIQSLDAAFEELLNRLERVKLGEKLQTLLAPLAVHVEKVHVGEVVLQVGDAANLETERKKIAFRFPSILLLSLTSSPDEVNILRGTVIRTACPRSRSIVSKDFGERRFSITRELMW